MDFSFVDAVGVFTSIFLITFLFIPGVIAYGLNEDFSHYWDEKTLSCFYWIYNKLNDIKFLKNNSFIIYIITLNLLVADLVYLLNETYIKLAMLLFIPCFILWFTALSIDRGNKESSFDKIYLEFASTVFTAFLIGLIFEGINGFIIVIEVTLLIMISLLSKNINKKEALEIKR